MAREEVIDRIFVQGFGCWDLHKDFNRIEPYNESDYTLWYRIYKDGKITLINSRYVITVRKIVKD